MKRLENVNLVNEKDKLMSFIGQGGRETPEMLLNERQTLASLAPKLGGFSGGSSPLQNRISRLIAEDSNQRNMSLARNNPLDYAQRQQEFQRLANAKLQTEMQRELNEEQKRAAAQAKRSAFLSGILGVGGAVGGAMVGGPAGAYIGSGIGSTVGSQV